MKSNYKQNTFGNRAIHFLNSLNAPCNLPIDIDVVYPYKDANVKQAVNDFYSTFFNDNNERVYVLGINPGRFGSGMTGIPFTDPVALEQVCGISNAFDKKRELTSEFVYKFIDTFGGARKFFNKFFLSAVSPLGFVRDGKNYNYYDSIDFYKLLRPFILKTLKEQILFGAKRTVILFGTGKNQHFFTDLNDQYGFFDTILTVEHPRYIMQYQRKNLDTYIRKYIEVFSQAL